MKTEMPLDRFQCFTKDDVRTIIARDLPGYKLVGWGPKHELPNLPVVQAAKIWARRHPVIQRMWINDPPPEEDLHISYLVAPETTHEEETEIYGFWHGDYMPVDDGFVNVDVINPRNYDPELLIDPDYVPWQGSIEIEFR